MNRCENYTLSCEAKDCGECDMFSWDGTGENPRKDNVPYADTHYGTVRIIIDIEFIDGTFTRGLIAHSIKFEPAEHWNLKVYKTQEDVYKCHPILYWGVKNIQVVGLLDSPKIFRDTAQQTKAFIDTVNHKVF